MSGTNYFGIILSVILAILLCIPVIFANVLYFSPLIKTIASGIESVIRKVRKIVNDSSTKGERL